MGPFALIHDSKPEKSPDHFGRCCSGLNFNSWIKFPALSSGCLSMLYGSQRHHNPALCIFQMGTRPRCWKGPSQLYIAIRGILHTCSLEDVIGFLLIAAYLLCLFFYTDSRRKNHTIVSAINNLSFSPDKAFYVYKIFTEVHFIYRKSAIINYKTCVEDCCNY